MKVTISDSQGIKVEAGSDGLAIDSAPNMSVVAITANTTLSKGGVYTVSGNSPVTVTMPLAASCPGANFVFRCVSAQAHVLTCSQESNGTKAFAGLAGATPSNLGSAFTLPATVGSSAVLTSDGLSFLFSAASGSCTISGTLCAIRFAYRE